ncbi:hypothetical protein [Ekhidna sp.]|uniref:hypothetical protein n=1 Tax=Ekhidna sp. TaxID=2608089 RepID=UPI003BABA417
MKYLIVSEGKIFAQLAKPLIQELERFDVRGEVVHLALDKKKVSKSVKDFQPDLLIAVGSLKMSSILELAKKRKINSCFFYHSLFDKNPRGDIQKFEKSRIYRDIPINENGNGSLVFDFVRKVDIETVDRKKPLISIVSGKVSKSSVQLSRKLISKSDSIEFQLINASNDLQEAVRKLSNANAVIATDPFSNMLAVFCNCPAINVYEKSIFSSTPNEKSIINRLINKEVVKSYPKSKDLLILNELDRILNDHQYSAGMMDDYQNLKSKIGAQPFVRNVSREIVDWLEDLD